MTSGPERLAGWGTRAGAALLDGLIVWTLVLVAMFVMAMVRVFLGLEAMNFTLWLLIVFLCGSAYYAGTMTRAGERNGQTLGKQTLGIRVVRNDGRPITPGTVALREVLLKFVLGWGTW